MYKPGPLNNLRAGSTNFAIRSVVDDEDNKWLLAMDVAALFEIKTAKLMQMVQSQDKTKANLRAHMTIPMISAEAFDIGNGLVELRLVEGDGAMVLPETTSIRPGKSSTNTLLRREPSKAISSRLTSGQDTPSKVLGKHLTSGQGAGGGNFSNVWLISARGMSHVIMKSRHPRATAINDWMYDTVLPSLILHGRYVVDEGELAEIRSMVVELKAQVEKLTEDRDLLKRENRVLWEHTDMRLGDLAGLDDTK